MEVAVCESYANHGHCPLGTTCQRSHDIDVILDRKEGFGRKRQCEAEESEEAPPLKKKCLSNGQSLSSSSCATSRPTTLFGGGHRAGFDAFMTGFVLAAHLAFRGRSTPEEEGKPLLAGPTGTEEEVNRIYLVSKDFPLLVQRSAFAKNSVGHYDKYSKLTTKSEDPDNTHAHI